MQFNRHTFPVQRKMAHSKHEKARRDFEPNMDQNPLTPKGTKEDGSMCALPLCALAHCLTTKRRPDGGAPRSAQESSAGRVRTSESGPTRAAQARAPRASRFATFLSRPSNDKLGVSKKGLSPLDLPPGLIRTVLSSREPPRAQISIK